MAMKIGNKETTNDLLLAPMAGVSDVGFRYLCSKYGASATVTEMLSARAMHHERKKTELMTITTDMEKIKIAQVFGKEPEIVSNVLTFPVLEKFDGFDINMGCPAPKIIKNGEGSALMKDFALASEIIKACKKVTTKPVSVKFRLGFDKIVASDFAKMCEESGADFITVHGRTTLQGYSGKANYEEIAKVKASVKIPVIGNGDVVDKKSYNEMKATGVDGVMIGRGAQGNPWLFSKLLGKRAKINKYEDIETHIKILREHFDEKWLRLYIRKHFLWYMSGIKDASRFRLQIATSPSVDESLKILKELL